MAISNTIVSDAQIDVFESDGSSAITFLSMCNLTNNTVTINLYLVPAFNPLTSACLVLRDLEITSGDTFEFYHAAEKIILDHGDKVVMESNAPSSVAVTVSSVKV